MAEIVKQPEAKRGNRKERVGEVVSNKMTKTIVVKVERDWTRDPRKLTEFGL